MLKTTHKSHLKHISHISKVNLLTFALIFGAIGGYILFHSFAAPNPNLLGDLNNDNSVNVVDLSILLSNYGTSSSTADLNNDGTVTILDLSILLSHYGQSVTAGGASWVTTDPADFPKLASHLSVEFNPNALSHFAFNVIRGCDAAAGDQSHALNPKQVNLVVPSTLVQVGTAIPTGCGSGNGVDAAFAITYGSGYWGDTSTINSPYPGIGSIRPVDSAACHDIGCYTNGNILFSSSDRSINMASSGNDNTTAEWAARLKSHWTLTELGGTSWQQNHPGVQGVWGDNFTWYENFTYYQGAGYGNSPFAFSGAQWDNGAVRNFQKLRSLLGNNMVLGGNGAADTCSANGNSHTVYDGSIANGNCIAADAAMWEATGYDIYSAAGTPGSAQHGWDNDVQFFDGWIKAGQAEGRAKYGIMVEYGTCGTGNLGHVLTAQDQRMGLALATIGGIDLWAVRDCDWGTTIVPGSANAIPEMGDNSTYPRGWLGQPTSNPIKVSSGRWKRTFTGGSVYGNVTGSAWAVDGITVPADDAKFVKS